MQDEQLLETAIQNYGKGLKKASLMTICQVLHRSYKANVLDNNSGVSETASFIGRSSLTPMQLSFTLAMRVGMMDNWRCDDHVLVTLWGNRVRGPLCISSIEKMDQEKMVGKTLVSLTNVCLTVPRESMKQVIEILNIPNLQKAHFNNCRLTLLSQKDNAILRKSKDLATTLLEGGERTESFLDQLYGTMKVDAETQAKQLMNPINLKKTLSLKSPKETRQFQLLKDQEDTISKCCSVTPTICVEAPYGTGKTVVGSHLAATAMEAGLGPIIVVSSTNSAVGQFSEYLSQTAGFQNLRPARFVTENFIHFIGNIREDHMVTDSDMPSIVKMIEASYQKSLSNEDLQLVQLFNNSREFVKENVLYAKKIRKDGTLQNNLTRTEQEQVRKFQECARTVERLRKDMIRIIFHIYKPNVLLFTIDFMMNLINDNFFYDYLKDTKLVIIDESSQILEITYLVLLASFKNASFRFFGDSKQLAPFTKRRNGFSCCVPVLQRLQHNNQSLQLNLRTTFRCHPALNEIPNKLIYENLLVSGSTATQKDQILKLISFPNKEKPTFFLDIPNGIATRAAESCSLTNHLEMDYCSRIITNLVLKGIKPSQIGIICYYADQKRHALSIFDKLGIEVRTVDSIQGREKDVTIILTTRTSGKNTDFVGNPKRTIVALTRGRLALFILGKADFLKTSGIWKDIILHYEQNRALIQPHHLDICLTPAPGFDAKQVDDLTKLFKKLCYSDNSSKA